ncbi:MAG TPA: NAD(P)/FAD-dependent oxidoreductase [Cyclobacteriaceae bacterium]|nr:NAD(P)/FAD-dependent oxidoreductase [Cyclobacteriaceae bacterium]
MNTKSVAICGAGLVGSLLAIYLKRRGYDISVFERRPDMRKANIGGGRSINLALSNRGLQALHEVGLEKEVRKMATPMHGRMMHDEQGNLNFQAYGKEGQFINSISRGGLNMLMMTKAEEMGAKFYFEHKIEKVDFEQTSITFSQQTTADSRQSADNTKSFDLIIGADGAFSAVRSAMQITDRFNYSQSYIEHGYKELSIPAADDGSFQLEKNALHIWPRKKFMLIALPNLDASFTVTLFLSMEGEISFAELEKDEEILDFFKKYFPDALNKIPDLIHEFRSNPTSSLVTVRCYPWVKNKTFLIGDAAHAIVPFYGQGMNAGFEDCFVLNALLDRYQDNWEKVLPEYQQLRKPDGDAIAELALNNFIEMRDKVADPKFLLQKKIEAKLHAHYPDKWIPLYTMVTFSEEMRYSQALRQGNKQQAIMDEVLNMPDVQNLWQKLDLATIIAKL